MEQTARSHLIDYKYVIGLALAVIAFYWTNRLDDDRRTTILEGRAAVTPAMRDREVDDLKARIASIEQYLRDHCGKSDG